MALIYIVEDDESIREIEEISLRNSNHIVYSFGNAKDFYKKLESILPDLVVLDVMLPDESGYEIVRKLRSQPATKRLPVIMVTAKTTEMDMIRGLEDGADDYIRKPFSVMELMVRIKALLRRTAEEETRSITLGNITLDNERRVLILDGSTVQLTYKEYELLKLLMLNQGIVLSREVIMQKVWGTSFEGESRTVDMHIKTIRKKLAGEGARIKSVRNVGYVME